ncbi:MAG: hypothetical protein B7Y03_14365 [Polaromonas sp. 24-62-144]|nr:MAG: hypothetical protein B7Y03_14365 [Polaromonas sp. 24-62-144]
MAGCAARTLRAAMPRAMWSLEIFMMLPWWWRAMWSLEIFMMLPWWWRVFSVRRALRRWRIGRVKLGKRTRVWRVSYTAAATIDQGIAENIPFKTEHLKPRSL